VESIVNGAHDRANGLRKLQQNDFVGSKFVIGPSGSSSSVATRTSRAKQIAASWLVLRSLTRPRVLLLAARLLTAFGLAVVVSPAAARADEIDMAFDAATTAGLFFGVNLTPTETAVAKDLVRCAVNAPRTKTVLDCAREELIKTLPPEARGLAECIGRESQPARCAQRAALNETQSQAFKAVNKLKADARSRLGSPEAGLIPNLIEIADGIRRNDWAKVAAYSSEEAAKQVAKALWRTLFPFLLPLAPVIDPVIDAAIGVRADYVRRVIEAAHRRDWRAVIQAVAEAGFHFNIPVVPLCAAIPSFDLKDEACGKALEIIGTLGAIPAEFGADLEEAYGLFRDGNFSEGARTLGCAPVEGAGSFVDTFTGWNPVRDTFLSWACPEDRPPPRKTAEQCKQYARQAVADARQNVSQGIAARCDQQAKLGRIETARRVAMKARIGAGCSGSVRSPLRSGARFTRNLCPCAAAGRGEARRGSCHS
jgi:hypothetical protein